MPPAGPRLRDGPRAGHEDRGGRQGARVSPRVGAPGHSWSGADVSVVQACGAPPRQPPTSARCRSPASPPRPRRRCWRRTIPPGARLRRDVCGSAPRRYSPDRLASRCRSANAQYGGPPAPRSRCAGPATAWRNVVAAGLAPPLGSACCAVSYPNRGRSTATPTGWAGR
jgi:hypothetical protein